MQVQWEEEPPPKRIDFSGCITDEVVESLFKHTTREDIIDFLSAYNSVYGRETIFSTPCKQNATLSDNVECILKHNFKLPEDKKILVSYVKYMFKDIFSHLSRNHIAQTNRYGDMINIDVKEHYNRDILVFARYFEIYIYYIQSTRGITFQHYEINKLPD